MKAKTISRLLALISLSTLLLTGCRQELEISGSNYYYTFKADSVSYCLQNNKLTILSNNHYSTDTVDGRKISHFDVNTYNDCYVSNNNIYYIGNHQITEEWNDGAPHYFLHRDLKFSEAFIEVNSVRKCFQFPGKNEGLIIAVDGNDIYYIFRATQTTAEMTYESYYVTKNGEEPTLLAQQQEEIYSLRKGEIKRCKMINGKLYFVGVKDGVGFYCEATNLRTPFYVSGWNGGAYDILEKDSALFVCGKNDGKAYVWKDSSPIELEFPNYAVESEARSMALVGEDLYVGGRIDEYPVIWKNGKIYATFFEFPPVNSPYHVAGEAQSLDHKDIKEEWGYVVDMVVAGDTIYSIVETDNFFKDNKRFALEWHFRNGKVYFDYDYDLVELIRTGQIELHPSFYGNVNNIGWVLWPRTYFGTPHIAPRSVKGKRKK